MLAIKRVSLILIVGLSLSACVSNPNTAVLTPLLGVAGGLAGSQIGQGKGKMVATGVGALLGAFTGNHIGSNFDQTRHNQSAISLMRLKQQQRQQSGMAPAPMVYPMPTAYPVAVPQQRGMFNNTFCSIKNNYVVCNGQ